MKKLFCFLFTIWMTNLLFAQTDNYQLAIDKFQANYNTEKYVEIFNSFSPEMKKALPIEDTQQFLANLKIRLAKLKTWSLSVISKEVMRFIKQVLRMLF